MIAKRTQGYKAGFFEIVTRDVGAVVVLELMGQLGQNEGSDHLLEVVESRLSAGKRNFVLDCSHLKGMSSYGVGLLIRAYVVVNEAKGRLLYCAMPDRVRRSFEVCTLHSPLGGLLFASCEEAVGELGECGGSL